MPVNNFKQVLERGIVVHIWFFFILFYFWLSLQQKRKGHLISLSAWSRNPKAFILSPHHIKYAKNPECFCTVNCIMFSSHLALLSVFTFHWSVVCFHLVVSLEGYHKLHYFNFYYCYYFKLLEVNTAWWIKVKNSYLKHSMEKKIWMVLFWRESLACSFEWFVFRKQKPHH